MQTTNTIKGKARASAHPDGGKQTLGIAYAGRMSYLGITDIEMADNNIVDPVTPVAGPKMPFSQPSRPFCSQLLHALTPRLRHP